MADIVFVLITGAFLGLCVVYIRACDRMVRADEAAEPAPEVTP